VRWKNSRRRKPLILRGVRQIGKTWLLKEFAKRNYEHIAYFNFDEHPEYKQFFENTRDVERILQNLMMASGQVVSPSKPETTLIVFDEIQECPNALSTLKYFCDFLIQRENDIFPVEVKSETNVESKSLKKFKEKYSDKVKLPVRYSLNNLRLDDDLLNIPLFMADYTDKLIGFALKQQGLGTSEPYPQNMHRE
jgi:predicted AAA+ superfamily ATPase